ncbi:MAG: NPCBM/NEW2 domain-containing protein, partial [Paludibacter sp.]
MKKNNFLESANVYKFRIQIIIWIVLFLCSLPKFNSATFASSIATIGNDTLYVPKNDSLPANAIWLESLDVSKIDQMNGKPAVIGKAFTGTPIMLNQEIYKHGIGTSAVSYIRVDLKKSATRFITDFNIDDVWKTKNLRSKGIIYVDGKKVYETEPNFSFKWPQKPYKISVNLVGASEMILVVMADGIYNGHCDWAGSYLLLAPRVKERPEIIPMSYSNIDIATPSNTVWLDKVYHAFISSGNGKGVGFWRTPQGNSISLNGKLYSRGYVACPN